MQRMQRLYIMAFIYTVYVQRCYRMVFTYTVYVDVAIDVTKKNDKHM